jgi:hypothetical protein
VGEDVRPKLEHQPARPLERLADHLLERLQLRIVPHPQPDVHEHRGQVGDRVVVQLGRNARSLLLGGRDQGFQRLDGLALRLPERHLRGHLVRYIEQEHADR